MNTNAIKNALNQVTPIDNDSWNEFEQYFSIRILRKNEILWNIGDICKHLVFINKGLLRLYHFSDDKEVCNQFFFEDKILTDYYSFTTQKPCIVAYDALEETELIVIPRAAIYIGYNQCQCFERLGRLIAEQNFIYLFESKVHVKNLSPEERYLKLMDERPKVMQRVPLKYIASYLGMTPEHLSRVRKKITQYA